MFEPGFSDRSASRITLLAGISASKPITQSIRRLRFVNRVFCDLGQCDRCELDLYLATHIDDVRSKQASLLLASGVCRRLISCLPTTDVRKYQIREHQYTTGHRNCSALSILRQHQGQSEDYLHAGRNDSCHRGVRVSSSQSIQPDHQNWRVEREYQRRNPVRW
jgi:hypothetical protein